MKFFAGDRRLAVVWIGECLMADVLDTAAGNTTDLFYLPRLTQLPEGARIVRVWHDPLRQAFGVLVAHPSFDLVADGDEPPEIRLEGVCIRLAEYRRIEPDK